MELNLGVTGAKRISFKDDNPRALARRLREKHPDWSHSDMVELLRDAIMQEGGAMVEACVEAAAANMLTAIDRERGPRPNRRSNAAMTAAAVKIGTAAVKAIVLLDLMMPNGKPLRFCTGAECTGFGDWYARLARKVGRTRIVGQVLDETAVRKIYVSAAKPTRPT